MVPENDYLKRVVQLVYSRG